MPQGSGARPGGRQRRRRGHVRARSDSIVTQPGGDARQWEAVVKKMVNVYGARISENDVKVIVESLSSASGPAK